MSKPGINFTTINGNLTVGVHLSTFLSYFQQYANKNGWVNFQVVENDNPKGDKGQYSHRLQIIEKKADRSASNDITQRDS